MSTNYATEGVPTCTCGRIMHPAKVPVFFVCLNCDGVQESEHGGKRKLTLSDKQYKKEMTKRQAEWYPGQTRADSSDFLFAGVSRETVESEVKVIHG